MFQFSMFLFKLAVTPNEAPDVLPSEGLISVARGRKKKQKRKRVSASQLLLSEEEDTVFGMPMLERVEPRHINRIDSEMPPRLQAYYSC